MSVEAMDNITRLLGKALCNLGELEINHRFCNAQHEVINEAGHIKHLLIHEKQAIPSETQIIYKIQEISQPEAIAFSTYSEAQLEQEVQKRTAQLKDEFLNTVSHELRTPLSTIKMAIQVLERVLQLSDDGQESQYLHNESKVKQCLTILREECDREISLINDLLALQQLEAELHPLLPTAIQLQAWIPEIVESFEDILHDRQQTLYANIPDDLPPLVSEISMFIAIFRELLTNACKFSPEGAAISVTARLVRSVSAHPESLNSTSTNAIDEANLAQKMQITVANSDVEISKSDLPLVFNKFYRVPNSDRWKQGGTGLGLALLKKRVEYLGGVVSVESDSGETRFTIELPNLMEVKPIVN